MNQSQTSKRPSGMVGFTIVWAGQLISVLASNMSWFAITIWAFEKTGSATVLGAAQTAFILPFLLISPFAGAMVDRYNRKLMMMISDLGAVIATTALLILSAADLMEIWHVYVACVIYGLSGTFQWPAYMAAISTMVPKEKYDRANGMMSLIDSGPAVFSPMIAGALLPFLGLTGILIIDVITFVFAIGTLLFVHVPQPTETKEGQSGKGTLTSEAVYGFKYIFQRKSLLGLLLVILCLNLVQGLSGALFAPMLLSRSGNNSTVLGSVQSAFAIGGVVGGLIVSAWGGLKKRITGMLVGWALFAFFGMIVFGLGRSLYIWIPAAVLASMTFPLTQSASNAIWQSKVAPDIQGRVFSARRLIAWLVEPIMPIVAGLMADYVTEPAMAAQSGLAETFGWLVGTGPGSGMSLQYIVSGLAYISIILVAWFIPTIRNVETLLPDHDQLEKADGQEAGPVAEAVS
ncbi:MAG TPA: MFS transporter [Anaerolineae bacterium]|nr:MFS transporter [Anaerolineae bacterium]